MADGWGSHGVAGLKAGGRLKPHSATRGWRFARPGCQALERAHGYLSDGVGAFLLADTGEDRSAILTPYEVRLGPLHDHLLLREEDDLSLATDLVQQLQKRHGPHRV